MSFRAGPGIGTITKAGLPLPVGEPAINPVPRAMIIENIAEVAGRNGCAGDAIVEISIPGGEALAQKTLNPRLGILGGLSILGTTGIVVPYSCAAWVHTIHRGVDVARAQGLAHIAGATGSVSEKAVQRLHDLPDDALIDMGDFVGGFLKYLRRHPVDSVTIAGGFAKMTKLGQGMLDLHARRGAVDLGFLAEHARRQRAAMRRLPSAFAPRIPGSKRWSWQEKPASISPERSRRRLGARPPKPWRMARSISKSLWSIAMDT